MKDDLDMQGILAAEVEKKKYVWQTKKKKWKELTTAWILEENEIRIQSVSLAPHPTTLLLEH